MNRTTNQEVRMTFRKLKRNNNAFSAKMGRFGNTVGTFRWNQSKNSILFTPRFNQSNANKYVFQVLNNNRIRWAKIPNRSSAQNLITGGQEYNWINYKTNNNSKNIYITDPVRPRGGMAAGAA